VAFFRREEVRVDLVTCAIAASVEIGEVDEATVVSVLRELAVMRRLVDAAEITCLLRLDELTVADPGLSPEHLAAAATRRSVAAATAAGERARSAIDLPAFRLRLANGEISGEHLDAFARALRSLEPHHRDELLRQQDALAAEAASITVQQFAALLRTHVRRIEDDDGRRRLERQRRQTGVRTWTDRDGMWNLAGRYDAATGMILAQLLQRQTERHLHAPRPADAPSDPLLAFQFLQAAALADLMAGRARGTGPAEIIVTIDEETWLRGRHDRTRADCGRGVEVPIETITALAGRARFVPVVLDRNGVVIRQGRPVPTFDELRRSLESPVDLDAGRTRRFATRHQRRALRAMYCTCAVPGCERHISVTQPHHLDEWEHGGRTDLGRLLPLCRHHHRRLHREAWQIEMRPDRSLVVRRDGEVIMSTGPPAEQWR
jgi:hypothetical protein